MDHLDIQGLSVETIIGVHHWEQHIKQRLLLDMSIPIDASHGQDSIEHTVDYDALCQAVVSLVEGKAFQLIETLAHETALMIKNTFSSVGEIVIKVTKPGAIANAQSVSVTVRR